MDNTKTKKNHSDDTPPLSTSWNKIYTFVLIVLIIEVILFYYFTRVFE